MSSDMGEPRKTHVLVTGPSGSGKTYLANAFRSHGRAAFDADKVGGLAGWFDEFGTKVRPPEEPSREFLDSHRFLWNRDALVEFLEPNSSVYLFGISRNALDMTDVFSKVYFLQVPPEILAERLQHPNRDNPMGRTPYQIEYSLYWARANEAKARSIGVEMVDGTLPSEELLLRIAP